MPILPSEIDTTQHFFDAFRNYETEISANWIVQFCQERGNWSPFTQKDIEAFYKSKGMIDVFTFNRLIEEDFILEKDGKYHITEKFKGKCYASAPVENVMIE